MEIFLEKGKWYLVGSIYRSPESMLYFQQKWFELFGNVIINII